MLHLKVSRHDGACYFCEVAFATKHEPMRIDFSSLNTEP